MTEILNWMTVLNEETEWRSRQDFLRWLALLVGRKANPDEAAIKNFVVVLASMRKQMTASHFGEALDIAWLDKQLADVRLQVVRPERGDKLPALRAQIRSAGDAGLLQMVSDTLLLQFAEFVNGSLQSSGTPLVGRCEGLYRDDDDGPTLPEFTYLPEQETRWRDELPVLREHDEDQTDDIIRCEDIFPYNPRARFCSNACRFNTFQIVKQLDDPEYLAAKQKRYRRRLEKSK